MRILIACEYSNIVASAFRSKGHAVLSCDLLKNDVTQEWHFQCDVFKLLSLYSFEMMIAFPPCTFLCKAQIPLLYHSPSRILESCKAVGFVRTLYNFNIPKIAIENPIGILSSVWRKPDQITSPSNFGNPHKKDICLWLKNLPPLIDTCINPRNQYVGNHTNGRMSQTEKSHIKSKFFPELASAMANQWS
jgi:hypothetical protein